MAGHLAASAGHQAGHLAGNLARNLAGACSWQKPGPGGNPRKPGGNLGFPPVHVAAAAAGNLAETWRRPPSGWPGAQVVSYAIARTRVYTLFVRLKLKLLSLY